MSAADLTEVLSNIYTPEVPDDADEFMPLGMTSMFGGHLLTPDETEQLAAKLLIHARTAREATAPGRGTGPTQEQWEQGWEDAVAKQ